MKKLIIMLNLLVIATTSVYSQMLITQVKPAGAKEWGYANLKGELVIPAQYDKCYKFSPDGYAAIYDGKAKQYYFINPKNERLTTEIPSFKIHDGFGFDIDGFKDGLIAIRVGEKWGFLNSKGKVAIAAKYDEVSEFSGGYATARSGTNWVVLNTSGEETKVDAPGITDVKEFSEGFAPYKSADKKLGFIGTNGKIAIPAKFESVGYFEDGMAWAKDGSGLGYINPKGDWAIQPQFDAGKNFDATSGLARIKTKAGTWAYVNKTGEITNVNDTDVWGDFSEGLCDGKKGEKRGFYDSKGKWVIAPQFDGVRDFKNGYAAAKMNDKWGMIDKTGKWVIQPTFDGIKDMEMVR